TCTFTNHRLPQLKLAKTTDPTSDSGTFDLSAGAQTFTNTGAGYGNGQDTGFHNVPQGSLTVSEAGHAPSSLSDYDSSVSCNSGKNGAAGTSHTFTANYGDVITCTFTNHRLPQLKLAKTTDPTSDSGTFDLSAVARAHTNTPATDRNRMPTGFHNVPQGSLTVSEAGHAPSSLSDYDSPSLHDALPIGAAGTSHTFTANYGDVITCTFTNHRLPQLKLAKTTDPTSDSGTFDLSAGAQTFTNTGAGYRSEERRVGKEVREGSLTDSQARKEQSSLDD